MNSINILIVEDEPIIAMDLERLLSKLNFNVLTSVESGEEALEFIEEQLPDLILMDIQLEGDLDGIDTAHMISKKYPIPIIFLTSNTDERTFNRAKLAQPHAYLSKPFRILDIKHSIDLAFVDDQPSSEALAANEQETLTNRVHDYVFVKSKEQLVKIVLAEIKYVEADSCYCNIVTKDKKYVIVSTLKKFNEAINFPKLFRVHRSYVVNIEAIDAIGEGSISVGDKKIPIGRSYREELFRRIPKY